RVPDVGCAGRLARERVMTLRPRAARDRTDAQGKGLRRDLNCSLARALELDQYNALELPHGESTATYGHRDRRPDERAQHMSPNVVGRVVSVRGCLRHEAVEHAEQVLGDALFVG